MSAPSSGWTPAEIGDQSGRTVVVTGANSGIGLEAAKVLAAHGARVVLAVRDPARGAGALDVVRRQGSAELLHLDLADQTSVRSAAETLAGRVDRVDLLLNNAGIMATPRRRTVDGFESQMATNHLGHFALTGLLLPQLLAAPAARVVAVSSNAHRLGRLSVEDPLGEQARYFSWTAYGRSKLANLLFTMELQRRFDAAGQAALAVAAHPGVAATNLVGSGPLRRIPGLATLGGAVNSLWAQPAEMGAWPTLYAATRSGLVGGEFVGPGGPGEWRGAPVLVRAAPAAYDEALARALWDRSAQLTGVDFGLLHR
jgi:NAD(P)-dependent dehydrogenase (short-subunit alcohol dehydrogenase family)